MSSILQTAERSSKLDPSENVIFQRHLIAYKECINLISGTVLEIGSGEGYGIKELSPKSQKYIAIDKFKTEIDLSKHQDSDIEFLKMNVPPLTDIDDNSIDFVVTFQVIEHIKNDKEFVKEIFRVLKKGGKLILTTPNILMSLSRSPWHIREYNPLEMKEILLTSFNIVDVKGVYGNDKVMNYYQKNKESVEKIRKWDIFGMENYMPRWILQIPYDILNRFNRYKLHERNSKLVDKVTYKDYFIDDVSDQCLDFFCISTK